MSYSLKMNLGQDVGRTIRMDLGEGVLGYICLDNLSRGPALGGCRIRPYQSEDEALADGRRLSQAMTYKNALARLPFGGGKAVIMGDPRTISLDVMRRYGEEVEKLGGDYYTGEDVGITAEHLIAVSETTQFVSGASEKTSFPSTATGVKAGMLAALDFVYGEDSLSNITVAIQGLGHVGSGLFGLLVDAGANVLVSDIDEAKLEALPYAAQIVSDPHKRKCDIFAPCALGGVLSHTTVSELRCPIVAGAANNQLASPDVDLGSILYAPDFAVNAGGVIELASFITGQPHEDMVDLVEAIGDTCYDIFSESEATGKSTHEIAIARAQELL